jgi:hypothetical protein
VIPAFWRLKQEDQEFKARLDCLMRLCLKKQNKKKERKKKNDSLLAADRRGQEQSPATSKTGTLDCAVLSQMLLSWFPEMFISISDAECQHFCPCF